MNLRLIFLSKSETDKEKRERKNILKERNTFYIEYVSQQSGCSLAEAKEKMDKLKASGVDYRYYVKRKLWCKTEEKLEKSIQSIVKARTGEKQKRKHYVMLVSKETGWGKRKTEKKIMQANLYSGCTFRDYYQFQFWDKTSEQQSEYYTRGVVEQLLMKYNTNLEEVRILKNKNLFAKKYEDLFHRAWFVNRKTSFDEFVQITKNVEDIITKPAFGTHGAGVEKYHIPSDMTEKEALYEKLMDKPKSQCEEFIKQHPAIAEFCPTSVNTIRMMTILDKGVCHYMYSVIRLGTGGLVDGSEFTLATEVVYTGVPYTQGRQRRLYDLNRFKQQLDQDCILSSHVLLGTDCSSAISFAWKKSDPRFPMMSTRKLFMDLCGKMKHVTNGEIYQRTVGATSTRELIQHNAVKNMTAAYRALKPGDGLLQYDSLEKKGHVMMVSQSKEDRIFIIDQKGFGEGWSGRDDTSWRVDKPFTHEQLLEDNFIPIFR